MQVLYERCAGIDVHKRTVVTTMLVTEASGGVNKRTRTFSTMTADLLALEAWLAEERVEQVAMESTGVYWYPLYNLLEETHHIVLVNPQHRRAWALERLAWAAAHPSSSHPRPDGSRETVFWDASWRPLWPQMLMLLHRIEDSADLARSSGNCTTCQTETPSSAPSRSALAPTLRT